MFFLVTLYFYEEQIYSENMYYTITLEFICKTFRIIFYLNFVHVYYILLRYNIHTYNIKQGRFRTYQRITKTQFWSKKNPIKMIKLQNYVHFLVLGQYQTLRAQCQNIFCKKTVLLHFLFTPLQAIKIAICQYRPCLIYVYCIYIVHIGILLYLKVKAF